MVADYNIFEINGLLDDRFVEWKVKGMNHCPIMLEQA